MRRRSNAVPSVHFVAGYTSLGMTIRLPWRIEKLPNAVPAILALIYLASAILKIDRGGYLCFDPWAPANTAMIPLEIGLSYFLWTKRCREFGALLSCAAMLGAATLLTWAHLSGRDVRGCGCFGAIRMPYEAHIAVIAFLFTLSFATLISSEGPPAEIESRNLAELRARFAQRSLESGSTCSPPNKGAREIIEQSPPKRT